MTMNAQYQRLQEEQERAIVQVQQRQKQLQKYKSDYVALKEKLQVLPDKTTHEIMVPIGTLGFMPGKMVHTNEVLVLLGDNWFVERSAKQAGEIVDRRIEELDHQVAELDKQKSLLTPRLQFTSEILQEAVGGVVDIRENYDPEEEKLWRERHKERVREHRQQLRQEFTHDQVMQLLSQLELEEEDVEDLDDEVKSDSEEELSDSGDVRLQYSDQTGDSIIYIRHSQISDSHLSSASSLESDETSSEQPLFRDPSDIRPTRTRELPSDARPKSILKTIPSTTPSAKVTFAEEDTVHEIHTSVARLQSSSTDHPESEKMKAFSETVTEHSTETVVSSPQQSIDSLTKPISKFKQIRLSKQS